MTVRVLLADDHPIVRAGLRGLLEAEPDIEGVGEAGDGRQAIDAVSRLHPDVVLMDLRMPDVDGVEATAVIRRDHPTTAVLVLTTYDTDSDILPAIEAGATGYLLKDAPPDELSRAVRSVSTGRSILAPSVASRLMSRLTAPRSETLTAREVEVLSLVAEGASNREIANALFISETTVKSHLLHIFVKLGVDDRTEAATLGLARGIIRLRN